jgi:hypothetical protein
LPAAWKTPRWGWTQYLFQILIAHLSAARLPVCSIENAPLGPYTIKLRQLCVKYGLYDNPVSVARLSGSECLRMIKSLIRDLQLQLPFANKALSKLKVCV